MLNTEIKIDQVAEVSFVKTIEHLQSANISYEVRTELKSTLIIVRRVETLESQVWITKKSFTFIECWKYVFKNFY